MIVAGGVLLIGGAVAFFIRERKNYKQPKLQITINSKNNSIQKPINQPINNNHIYELTKFSNRDVKK